MMGESAVITFCGPCGSVARRGTFRRQSQRLQAALEPVRWKEGFLLLVKSRHFSYHAAYDALKQICTAAEVRPFGYHVCRHTFARRLATLDASPHAIQNLMGHATLQVTLRYPHVNERHLRVTTALRKAGARHAFGHPWAKTPIAAKNSNENSV